MIADRADSWLLCISHRKLNYFWAYVWGRTLLKKDTFITSHITLPQPQPHTLKTAFYPTFPSPDSQSPSNSYVPWPFSLTLPLNISVQSLHQSLSSPLLVSFLSKLLPGYYSPDAFLHLILFFIIILIRWFKIFRFYKFITKIPNGKIHY